MCEYQGLTGLKEGHKSMHRSLNSNLWGWKRCYATISQFCKRPGGFWENVSRQDTFRGVTRVRARVLYIYISSLRPWSWNHIFIRYKSIESCLLTAGKKDQEKSSKTNRGTERQMHNLLGGKHSSLNRMLWDYRRGRACLLVNGGRGGGK